MIGDQISHLKYPTWKPFESQGTSPTTTSHCSLIAPDTTSTAATKSKEIVKEIPNPHQTLIYYIYNNANIIESCIPIQPFEESNHQDDTRQHNNEVNNTIQSRLP